MHLRPNEEARGAGFPLEQLYAISSFPGFRPGTGLQFNAVQQSSLNKK